ncbi:TetR/AcrR family transcriptional regulator [Isoptericola cucumis]
MRDNEPSGGAPARRRRGEPSGGAPARRRRGEALEGALLEAAWDELVEHGYAALTFEGVAARAGTSRPVVRRRWASRAELARAAIVRRSRAHPATEPDTGSLRGDLLALLAGVVDRRAEMTALVATSFGAYFEETGTSFADLRAEVVGGRTLAVDGVLERAVERGEIDRSVLTPRVVALPFDLLRHELLMTLRPVPRSVLEEIVDDIFLPLVAARSRAER